MTYRNHFLDTSQELLVQRRRNGILLVKPNNQNQVLPSIRDLFNMPFNVYFYNARNLYQDMNEANANIVGLTSAEEGIGKSLFQLTTKKHALFAINNNNKAMHNNAINIVEEQAIIKKTEKYISCISIKFPWYNETGKIIGVFGCSILLDQHAPISLAKSFSKLMQTGLLANENFVTVSQFSPSLQDNIPFEVIQKLSMRTQQNFSKREMECLFYLMQGKSARETGRLLQISQRTVETHLEWLKEKLHCRKKSEIIETIARIIND